MPFDSVVIEDSEDINCHSHIDTRNGYFSSSARSPSQTQSSEINPKESLKKKNSHTFPNTFCTHWADSAATAFLQIGYIGRYYFLFPCFRFYPIAFRKREKSLYIYRLPISPSPIHTSYYNIDISSYPYICSGIPSFFALSLSIVHPLMQL